MIGIPVLNVSFAECRIEIDIALTSKVEGLVGPTSRAATQTEGVQHPQVLFNRHIHVQGNDLPERLAGTATLPFCCWCCTSATSPAAVPLGDIELLIRLSDASWLPNGEPGRWEVALLMEGRGLPREGV
jgi:hypothetical protein